MHFEDHGYDAFVIARGSGELAALKAVHIIRRP